MSKGFIIRTYTPDVGQHAMHQLKNDNTPFIQKIPIFEGRNLENEEDRLLTSLFRIAV